MKLSDIHWLAGLLEGEGSFGFYESRGAGFLALQLGMADLDVMQRAKKLMGVTSLIHRRKANSKSTVTHYCFSLRGHRAAGWMMTLYSLLGQRRQKRIRESLAQWKTRKSCSRLVNLCGHPDRKPAARRMCKSCYCMFKQGRLRFDLHPGLHQ